MNSDSNDQQLTQKSGRQIEAPHALEGGQITLGEKLRRARQAKGGSLNEAAAATRIHASTLAALEKDNFQGLPAQVFTRGFVRIYAAYLGLDPNQALRQHIEEQGLSAASTTDKINIQEILASESMAEAPRRVTGNHLFILLLLLVLGFIGYWGYNNYFRPQAPLTLLPLEFPVLERPAEREVPRDGKPETAPAEEQSAPPPAPEPLKSGRPSALATAPAPPPALPEAAPVPTAETSPATAPEAAYVLVADFVEDTWLRIQVDNGPARQHSFRAGDRQVWQAREKMELRIGNAGGVHLALNESPLPSLGRSGQTVKLRLP